MKTTDDCGRTLDHFQGDELRCLSSGRASEEDLRVHSFGRVVMSPWKIAQTWPELLSNLRHPCQLTFVFLGRKKERKEKEKVHNKRDSSETKHFYLLNFLFHECERRNFKSRIRADRESPSQTCMLSYTWQNEMLDQGSHLVFKTQTSNMFFHQRK